jgi:glycosyltransferase involved in cell wall biosynthesis
MKILFVLHQYMPRHVTGTEQYARSLALGLRARGHDVHVFAYEPLIQFEAPGRDSFVREEIVEGVPVHRCSVHPRHSANRELGEYENPLVGELFAQWFEGRGFELVHVFHLRNVGLSVLRECRERAVPVVVHLMDFWFLCPNFLLLRRDGSLCDGPPDGGFGCIGCVAPALDDELRRSGLRPQIEALAAAAPPRAGLQPTVARRAHALVVRKEQMFAALRAASAVIAPSRFLRSVFEAQGFPAGQIRHLPYGLDLTRLQSAAAERKRGRRRGDTLHVGYVGSISHHKGVHVLIAAVRRSERADLRLRVHGGLESHPDYSAELRALAGDDPRIEFRGRFEPRDLGNVLGQLDLIVVPLLWYENTPFSMLEALWFGLPVVASDLGGIAEIVQHGRNGLLFPAGDVDALAAHLVRLAGDRDELRSLGGGARVPDVEVDVGALLQLYARLLPRARAGKAP